MSDKTKAIVAWLNGQECCQAHGGPGCHPSRCGECPRDAADAITQLQRDNAALMEDAAAQIQIAREAVERAAGLEQPTLEMIQAGLAVRWPALYRDCLYGEHDGIHLRAETETRINMMRQQYLAMVGAAVSHKED